MQRLSHGFKRPAPPTIAVVLQIQLEAPCVQLRIAQSAYGRQFTSCVKRCASK